MGDFLSDIGNFLTGAVSGVVNDLDSIDPISLGAKALSGLLNDIGVPKELTDGLEIAAGAMTGDVALLAQGATGEVSDLSKDLSSKPATTEVANSPTAPPPQGYADTPGGIMEPPIPSPNSLGALAPPNPGGGCDDLQSILNDPSLSLEDKVMMILEQAYNQMDSQVQSMASQFANASQNGANAQGGGGSTGSAGGANGSGTSTANLQLNLQDLMQKRTQLMDMMSNLSKTFNDSAMNTINNTKG